MDCLSTIASWIVSSWPYINGTAQFLSAILIGILTAILSWRKILDKVAVSYTIHHHRLSASRIDHLSIFNLKDKPIVIYGIYAILDKSLVIPIEKFETPIIIGGLETKLIRTTPFSFMTMGGTIYDTTQITNHLIEIYISTPNKNIKCRTIPPANSFFLNKFKSYPVGIKATNKYNGIVYNDKAAFGISYTHNETTHHAILENNGHITSTWSFEPHKIDTDNLKSPATVKVALLETSAKYYLDAEDISVRDLRST